jgi:3-hydroxymyristoyl/3-hydroxydecanoyl-(acyl carrier protein) dehydratase
MLARVPSPHGTGFSLIEQIVSCDPENLQVLASFRHTPGKILQIDDHRPSVLPGVVLVEAACQTLYVLTTNHPVLKDRQFLLAKVHDFTFFKPIQYDDEICLDCKICKIARNYVIAKVVAKVNDKMVSKGDLAFWTIQ